MRIRYEHGGEHPLPEELRKKQIMSSLNQSLPVSNDPILNRLASERFAQDYSNMREEAYDQNIIPDPRETGRADMDKSYILEAALLGAPLGRIGTGANAVAKAAPKTAVRGGVPEIDKLRAQDLSNFSNAMGQRRNIAMLDAQQQKIANDRLEYISDRLLNEAKTEDIVSNLDLQAQLTDVLDSAIKGERDRVDKILSGIVKEGQSRRAIEDEINALVELLTGRSGGQAGRIMDPNIGILGNYSMSPYLALGEQKFKEKLGRNIWGLPRLPYDITRPASLNEFGGIIKVVKGQ